MKTLAETCLDLADCLEIVRIDATPIRTLVAQYIDLLGGAAQSTGVAGDYESAAKRCDREAVKADAQAEPSRQDGVPGNPDHWRGYAHAMREYAMWLRREAAREPSPPLTVETVRRAALDAWDEAYPEEANEYARRRTAFGAALARILSRSRPTGDRR